MQTFKKILHLLTPKEFRKACLLLIMIIIMAILEMIGVASILPFVTVLTNPSIIETNFILNHMFQASSIFGVEDNQEFLFSLGILVFILLVTSLVFKAITTYTQIWFVQTLQYSLSKRLLEKYLSQSYSWYLTRNSAEFSKNILDEIAIVIGNGVSTLLELIAKSIIAIALLALLIATNIKVTLIVGLSLGVSYLVIYKFTSNYVSRMGEERFKKNELLFRSISEAFGAIKEIKMGNLEQGYVSRFSDPARIIAKNVASSSIIAQLPRFVLEAIAFGGIILLILYLMKQTGSFNNALPIISLFAFAGYRLMPALQQIYVSFSKFDFIIPSLNKIHSDYVELKVSTLNLEQESISLKNNIYLENVSYEYPNASRTAIKNMNLTIPTNTTVGFIGATGSGKTTTVDIILGLLEPQKGTIKVDEKVITRQNFRNWQRCIGYVPQYIYLSDDNIASNIAFGVEPKNINQKAVERASKIANLHEFIVNELPEKYQTSIGERGVRLSGGQRQRIGIARALYHNPKVLILDEATNALDNVTEQAVMDAVNNLNKHITIILIAHRLNTVKKCNKIYLFDRGEIKNEGTFEELIKSNENFLINAKDHK